MQSQVVILNFNLPYKISEGKDKSKLDFSEVLRRVDLTLVKNPLRKALKLLDEHECFNYTRHMFKYILNPKCNYAIELARRIQFEVRSNFYPSWQSEEMIETIEFFLKEVEHSHSSHDENLSEKCLKLIYESNISLIRTNIVRRDCQTCQKLIRKIMKRTENKSILQESDIKRQFFEDKGTQTLDTDNLNQIEEPLPKKKICDECSKRLMNLEKNKVDPLTLELPLTVMKNINNNSGTGTFLLEIEDNNTKTEKILEQKFYVDPVIVIDSNKKGNSRPDSTSEEECMNDKESDSNKKKGSISAVKNNPSIMLSMATSWMSTTLYKSDKMMHSFLSHYCIGRTKSNQYKINGKHSVLSFLNLPDSWFFKYFGVPEFKDKSAESLLEDLSRCRKLFKEGFHRFFEISESEFDVQLSQRPHMEKETENWLKKNRQEIKQSLTEDFTSQFYSSDGTIKPVPEYLDQKEIFKKNIAFKGKRCRFLYD